MHNSIQVQNLTSALTALDAINVSQIRDLVQSANDSIHNITAILTEEVEELGECIQQQRDIQ